MLPIAIQPCDLDLYGDLFQGHYSYNSRDEYVTIYYSSQCLDSTQNQWVGVFEGGGLAPCVTDYSFNLPEGIMASFLY